MPATRIAATIQASPITFSYRLVIASAIGASTPCGAAEQVERERPREQVDHASSRGSSSRSRSAPPPTGRSSAAPRRGRSRRRRRGSPASTPTAGSGRPGRPPSCDSGAMLLDQVGAAKLGRRSRPRQPEPRQHRAHAEREPASHAAASRSTGRAPGEVSRIAQHVLVHRLDLQLGDAVVDVAHQAAAAAVAAHALDQRRGPRGPGRAARARGAPRRRSPGRRSAGCRSGSRSRRRRSSCWVARISVAFSARPSRLSRSISRRPSREASRNHASSNSTTLCTERSPDTSRIAYAAISFSVATPSRSAWS